MPSRLTDPGRARSPSDRGGHRLSQAAHSQCHGQWVALWLPGAPAPSASAVSSGIWGRGAWPIGCVPPSVRQHGGEADTTPPRGLPQQALHPLALSCAVGLWEPAGTRHRLAFPRKAPWASSPLTAAQPPTPVRHPHGARAARQAAELSARLGRVLLQGLPPAATLSGQDHLPLQGETGREGLRPGQGPVCKGTACASRFDQQCPLGRRWARGGDTGPNPTAEAPALGLPHTWDWAGPCPARSGPLGDSGSLAPLVAPRAAQPAAGIDDHVARKPPPPGSPPGWLLLLPPLPCPQKNQKDQRGQPLRSGLMGRAPLDQGQDHRPPSIRLAETLGEEPFPDLGVPAYPQGFLAVTSKVPPSADPVEGPSPSPPCPTGEGWVDIPREARAAFPMEPGSTRGEPLHPATRAQYPGKPPSCSPSLFISAARTRPGPGAQ